MKRILIAILAFAMMISLFTSCISEEEKVDAMSEREIAALRATAVFETENFKIDGMMMKYMLNKSLVDNYAVCLLGGIDLTKSFRELTFRPEHFSEIGRTIFDRFVGDPEKYEGFQGSWYDLFWSVTCDRARETLALCETAKEKYIKLDASDLAKLEKRVDGIMEDLNVFGSEIYVQLNSSADLESDGGFGFGSGVSYQPVVDGSFVTQIGSPESFNDIYGTGVTRDDVYRAEELMALAEKCRQTLSDGLYQSIKADSERIESCFEADKNYFYKVDYLSFIVPYSRDVQSATERMMSCTSEDEFTEAAIDILFESCWDENYDTVLTELQKGMTFDDGSSMSYNDIPPYEDVIAKKEEAKETVIAGLLNGESAEELPSLGDKKFDKAVSLVRDRIYGEIADKYEAITVKGGRFDGESSADGWTFSEDRASGDVSAFEVEVNDGIDDTFEVRFIVSPKYLDEANAVSFGHILVPTLEAAETLLFEFKSDPLTVDSFKELATENTEDTEVFYSDVLPGEIISGVNEWLFEEGRQVGDVSIVQSDRGYHLMYLTEISALSAWETEVVRAIHGRELDGFIESELWSGEAKYCGDSIKASIEIIGKRMFSMPKGSKDVPAAQTK